MKFPLIQFFLLLCGGLFLTSASVQAQNTVAPPVPGSPEHAAQNFQLTEVVVSNTITATNPATTTLRVVVQKPVGYRVLNWVGLLRTAATKVVFQPGIAYDGVTAAASVNYTFSLSTLGLASGSSYTVDGQFPGATGPLVFGSKPFVMPSVATVQLTSLAPSTAPTGGWDVRVQGTAGAGQMFTSVPNPVLAGRVYTLALTTGPDLTASPIGAPPLDRTFNLTPAPGSYTFNVTLNGALAATRPFVVPTPPVPPVSPETVRLASLNPMRTPTGAWQMQVALAVPTGRVITNWGAAVLDGTNFTANITSAAGDVSVALGAPTSVLTDSTVQADGTTAAAGANGATTGTATTGFSLAQRTYELGNLTDGSYVFSVVVDAKPVGQRTFVVQAAPPPAPQVVISNMAVLAPTATANTWRLAVQALTTDPTLTVTNWGNVTRTGTAFQACLTLGPAVTPLTTNAPTAALTHTYDLGTLDPGNYSFAICLDAAQLAMRLFTVVATPPVVPPAASLAYVVVRQGTVSAAAEVGLNIPTDKTVSAWGSVTRVANTNTLQVSVSILGDATATAATSAASVKLVRNTYALPALSAGAYVLEVLANGISLGSRPFSISPVLPPPPRPQVIVQSVAPATISAGNSAVRVQLAFLQPGWEVKSWGNAARTQNTFNIEITTGAAAVVPQDPTIVPVPTPVDTNPAITATNGLIGGWPILSVNHSYDLGAVLDGAFRFNVKVDGVLRAAPTLVFGNAARPRPVVVVNSSGVRNVQAADHAFTISYISKTAWAANPTLGTVTLKGPHGFTASARLASTSLPPTAVGIYQVIGNYLFAAPGGTWGAEDNGTYEVHIDLAAVKDTAGLSPLLTLVGRVNVAIPTIPTPPVDRVVSSSVTLVDGRWQADVSFANAGYWVIRSWGQIVRNGTFLVAQAQLDTVATIAGGLVAVPNPGSFAHTYDLGELTPGSYRFIFLTNQGHAKSLEFTIEGEAPPIVAAYLQDATSSKGAAAQLQSAARIPQPVDLMDYYLGGRRQSPTTTRVQQNGHDFLSMSYQRIVDASASIRPGIEVSNDLQNWLPATSGITTTAGTPRSDGTQDVTVTQTQPLGTAGSYKYMRLKLVENP